MQSTISLSLPVAFFEDGREMLLAGLSRRMFNNSPAGIPAQWKRFTPYIGTLPAQVGQLCYGAVLANGEGGDMDYVCAVEVSSFAYLPAELRQIRVAAQRYAVFHHTGHVSGVGATWSAVLDEWVPHAGFELVDAPCFERYGERFDPRTGRGGLDLMIPVRPK